MESRKFATGRPMPTTGTTGSNPIPSQISRINPTRPASIRDGPRSNTKSLGNFRRLSSRKSSDWPNFPSLTGSIQPVKWAIFRSAAAANWWEAPKPGGGGWKVLLKPRSAHIVNSGVSRVRSNPGHPTPPIGGCTPCRCFTNPNLLTEFGLGIMDEPARSP